MRNSETQSNSASVQAPVSNRAQPPIPAWLTAGLLALVTMAVFWPALSHDFVNYDDDHYITENAQVQNGLSWENVKWAFCNSVDANWHPLTVLSHMLDCQLFGLKPWGHHLTGVLFHAVNTALVFLLLRALTGTYWRSVLVAALFGVHPLRVESVAWVAERKDVLSLFFGLLTLWFYARYVSESKAQSPRSKVFYRLALLFFALGLMSKPMLVTWPFVMLLLDYWPLQRVSSFKFSVSSSGATPLSIFKPKLSTLLLEKLPFFVLAAVASVVTYEVQQHIGAMQLGLSLPLAVRAGNALMSYCRYLGKLFWPVDLAVFYPHPGQWPEEQVMLAGGLLLGLSVFFFAARRQYPFLLMGWLWFVGTLVPVIGLVQVGGQAMADRYTYIPSLGVLILVVWGLSELTRAWRCQVLVTAVMGGAAVILCCAVTRHQLGYWRDSEALFRHALAVTENHYLAHYNLANAYVKQNRMDEAIEQYQEAIRLKPDYFDAYNNLGNVLGMKGQIGDAINVFQEIIRLKPDNADAHYNLGIALGRQGRSEEAIGQFQEAIRLKPDYIDAYNNLGNVLGMTGRMDDAISQFQEIIRLKPDDAGAHYNLGIAFARAGRLEEAAGQFQEAVRLKPDYVEARNNLARALEMKNAPAGR